MNITPETLEGVHVRLEPLTAQHLPALAAAIRDGELWTIPVTFVPHPDDLPSFLADAEAAQRAGRELAFATFDKRRDALVGSTRFMEIDRTHRRLEIGFTFLAASAQRTHVNTEAKYLMLRLAFERWGMQRVQLITDVRNDKSRRAIARLGAQQEGIMRSHMVMRDGHIRDSVLFSIVRDEWSHVRRELERKLAAA